MGSESIGDHADHYKVSGFHSEGDGNHCRVLRRSIVGLDLHFKRISLESVLRLGYGEQWGCREATVIIQERDDGDKDHGINSGSKKSWILEIFKVHPT